MSAALMSRHADNAIGRMRKELPVHLRGPFRAAARLYRAGFLEVVETKVDGSEIVFGGTGATVRFKLQTTAKGGDPR